MRAQSSRLIAAILRVLPCVIGGFVVGIVGGAVASADRPSALMHGLWPIWSCYVVLAGVMGLITRGPAWIAGAIMTPVHMIWMILADDGSLKHAGPPTYTSCLGYVFLLFMMLPPAVAGFFGSIVRRIFRGRPFDSPPASRDPR